MAIHINSNGEPGVCKAQKGGCPFGAPDTHFESTAEASRAYEWAQSAMGNGINSRSIKEDGTYEDDSNYEIYESKEEALKVANIIANEGKFAGIVTIHNSYSERPDSDNFDTDEEYEEAESDWYDNFSERIYEPAEDAEVEYIVRGFDKWEDRNKFTPEAWVPTAMHMDESEFDLNGNPDDVFEQGPTEDQSNNRWWNSSMEFVSPKSK